VYARLRFTVSRNASRRGWSARAVCMTTLTAPAPLRASRDRRTTIPPRGYTRPVDDAQEAETRRQPSRNDFVPPCRITSADRDVYNRSPWQRFRTTRMLYDYRVDGAHLSSCAVGTWFFGGGCCMRTTALRNAQQLKPVESRLYLPRHQAVNNCHGYRNDSRAIRPVARPCTHKRARASVVHSGHHFEKL